MSGDLDARRRAAYAKLDEVVHELVAIAEEKHNEDPDNYQLHTAPADYLLIVGSMFIDSDGDRNGIVTVFPRDGYQPPYISAGLLSLASAHIT